MYKSNRKQNPGKCLLNIYLIFTLILARLLYAGCFWNTIFIFNINRYSTIVLALKKDWHLLMVKVNILMLFLEHVIPDALHCLYFLPFTLLQPFCLVSVVYLPPWLSFSKYVIFVIIEKLPYKYETEILQIITTNDFLWFIVVNTNRKYFYC